MTGTDQPKPLVTVVVPAYNAEGFIAATLRSIVDQTYDNVEVIILDDKSTDGTAAVAEAFGAQDPRFRVVRLPRNFGAPAGPRNIGVREARGQWVAFLDADDIWHPEKLDIQIAELIRRGAKFCSTQMLDFASDAELRFTPPGQYRVRRISFLSQLFKYQTPTSSVVVDTALMRETPFNEDLRYKAREDLDCWLRCHEKLGHSIKIEHPLLGYRQSAQQISGNKMKMVKRHYYVLGKYRTLAGRRLGRAGAALFTATHFGLSIYSRLMRGRL